MKAADVLARARALLLDFDGPICSVFAGLPASSVADQLRGVLADGGHVDVPEWVATSGDPFEVFQYAATLGKDEARCVEAAFAAREVEAISSAIPASGAHELIEAWYDSGRALAVVSNNNASAVGAYLELYNLRGMVDFISARTGSDAALLKPHPYLLRLALAALMVAPGESVFVGDSITDIEAARSASVFSVGYANKPKKFDDLTGAGAGLVVSRLQDLHIVNVR
ncbi:HAD-IA family hydrolase [Amycolatopsis sp. A133]|uniref:HAD family hydrolase n=1 Tax=Amycolatopsis sp. A133 TaxID=3064472 RepID=UPI0027F61562|nr:HAD-IA family hydrolase [Amycolatopsis sp. A133]MDQ7805875.1 HAD-IA family hydrolase [Amycolatopsis sp. A133]